MFFKDSFLWELEIGKGPILLEPFLMVTSGSTLSDQTKKNIMRRKEKNDWTFKINIKKMILAIL